MNGFSWKCSLKKRETNSRGNVRNRQTRLQIHCTAPTLLGQKPTGTPEWGKSCLAMSGDTGESGVPPWGSGPTPGGRQCTEESKRVEGKKKLVRAYQRTWKGQKPKWSLCGNQIICGTHGFTHPYTCLCTCTGVCLPASFLCLRGKAIICERRCIQLLQLDNIKYSNSFFTFCRERMQQSHQQGIGVW